MNDLSIRDLRLRLDVVFFVTMRIVEDGVVVRPPGIGHAAEERRQPPILILRPTIERVIVTLAAIDAAAEEDTDLLIDNLLHGSGLVGAVQNHSRRAVVTLSGDVLASDPIVRLVFRDALAHPFPEHAEPRVFSPHTKQIGKAEGPEIYFEIQSLVPTPIDVFIYSGTLAAVLNASGKRP